MKDVILSTKGTNSQYHRLGLISAIMLAIIGAFIVGAYCFLSSHSSNDSLILILLIGLFCLGDGIVSGIIKHFFAKSYAEVTESGIRGVGIQNFNLPEFDIPHHQIQNISAEGIMIHIHTSGGVYKIVSDKKTAKKFFDYYHMRNMARSGETERKDIVRK